MDLNIIQIITIAILILICIMPLLARHMEKKDFNNGICPNCGNKLHNFDCDSQGGRGYICRECGYTTWVSYKVDRNYVD